MSGVEHSRLRVFRPTTDRDDQSTTDIATKKSNAETVEQRAATFRRAVFNTQVPHPGLIVCSFSTPEHEAALSNALDGESPTCMIKRHSDRRVSVTLTIPPMPALTVIPYDRTRWHLAIQSRRHRTEDLESPILKFVSLRLDRGSTARAAGELREPDCAQQVITTFSPDGTPELGKNPSTKAIRTLAQIDAALASIARDSNDR